MIIKNGLASSRFLQIHTVGLESNGKMVAGITANLGFHEYGVCDVGNWEDISAVSAGAIVGLKSDGTVVAIGDNVRSV